MSGISVTAGQVLQVGNCPGYTEKRTVGVFITVRTQELKIEGRVEVFS